MATQGSVKQSLRKAAPSSSEAVIEREALALRSWAKQCAQVYRPAVQAGLLTPGLLSTWQEEILLELHLMEQEEAQAQQLREEIQDLYQQVRPRGKLNTIPGIGPRVGPLLLAAIGDIQRFRNAKALRQWTGLMPRSHQSSHTQRLGLGMTKEGPARVKRLCIKQRITPGSGTQRWQPSTTGRWWSWARPINRPWG